jgi:hypothetical protein
MAQFALASPSSAKNKLERSAVILSKFGTHARDSVVFTQSILSMINLLQTESNRVIFSMPENLVASAYFAKATLRDFCHYTALQFRFKMSTQIYFLGFGTGFFNVFKISYFSSVRLDQTTCRYAPHFIVRHCTNEL